tara:strand:- start:1329 stop:1607 length:279 start_codon:yes stop_codon:yes gene_type:complete
MLQNGEKMSQSLIDNKMIKAVLVTLFCCLPFGIVAIVKASEVNGKLAAGDVEGAQFSAAEADKWANYGLILGIVGGVIYFLLQILGIVALGL